MTNSPLADRIRPRSFDDIVGQKKLFGPDGTIRRMLSRGYLPNMVFWGPPGTGKTTAADIIAKSSDKAIRRINATTASLSDVKEAIADVSGIFGSGGVLIYLDEILSPRFLVGKAVLLAHVLNVCRNLLFRDFRTIDDARKGSR